MFSFWGFIISALLAVLQIGALADYEFTVIVVSGLPT